MTTLEKEILNTMTTAVNNGWVSKGMRRASIHFALTVQNILPQVCGDKFDEALRSLVAKQKITFRNTSKGSYYSLNS